MKKLLFIMAFVLSVVSQLNNADAGGLSFSTTSNYSATSLFQDNWYGHDTQISTTSILATGAATQQAFNIGYSGVTLLQVGSFGAYAGGATSGTSNLAAIFGPRIGILSNGYIAVTPAIDINSPHPFTHPLIGASLNFPTSWFSK